MRARAGGGINNDGGTLTLNNSLLARNGVATGGLGPDIFGNVISKGYNLIEITQGIASYTGNTAQNITGQSAKLGPLQNNGGLTPTRWLLPGSPAIDAGNSPLTTDQRGQPRPIDYPTVVNAVGGNGSDIGAVEVGY